MVLDHPTLCDAVRTVAREVGPDAFGLRALQPALGGSQDHGRVRDECESGGEGRHHRRTAGGVGMHKLGGGKVRDNGQAETLTMQRSITGWFGTKIHLERARDKS